MSNEEVRDKLQQLPVSTIICRCCLHWFGHDLRLLMPRCANQAIKWLINRAEKREDRLKWTNSRQWTETSYRSTKGGLTSGGWHTWWNNLDCFICGAVPEQIILNFTSSYYCHPPTYAWKYIHMHTYTSAHTSTFMLVHFHTQTLSYTEAHIFICTLIHTHRYTWTYIYSHSYTYMHTYTLSQTYTYSHTCTNIQLHT